MNRPYKEVLMSQKPIRFFLISLCTLFLFSCNNPLIEDIPKESQKETQNTIKKEKGGHRVYLATGEKIFFEDRYKLSEEEMINIALDMTSKEELEEENNLDQSDDNLRIAPGQTRKYRVWTRRTDRHYSSQNGYRTFSIWVPDNRTKVKAYWYEETQAGINNWVFRGYEMVSGANKRFSRTVYLDSRENFKIKVVGEKSSPRKRRICYYYVSCSSNFGDVKAYNSGDFTNTSTWFEAASNQKWYWGGATTWMVVNDIAKEILLLDGYVDKSTLGANRNYYIKPSERRRVARFVNVIRDFVAKGYDVKGILTSHRHGDHIGDIPYILGGIKSNNKNDFMKSGVALTGAGYKNKIPVYMNRETESDPYYANKTYDNSYMKPDSIVYPAFHNGYIDGKEFTAGSLFSFGDFQITPYIWYHGKLADGVKDNIRTLAYNIQCRRRHRFDKTAKTFFTSGYVERSANLNHINREIQAHHIIFADGGNMETAKSAKTIKLLNSSPVGYNYIIANHIDNNSNKYGMTNNREETQELLARFMQAGIVNMDNGNVKWRGTPTKLRLGYFNNRLGD